MLDFTHLSPTDEHLPGLTLIDSDTGYKAVHVTGADAADFLHGQLTANIATLPVGQGIPAALCTVQGRVTSTLDVLHVNSGLWLIIPAPLVDIVINQLRKYVMRSKVVFSAEAAPVSLRFDAAATTPGQVTASESVVTYAPSWATTPTTHGLLLISLTAINDDAGNNLVSDWSTLQVLLGVSAIDLNSSDQHLPQMLNLDLLGSVDFHKGCYTGQEIIARTHFRGKVKRRMLRFVIRSELKLNSGDVLHTNDGKKAGEVVNVAHDDKGNTGILAVVKLDQLDKALFISEQPASAWDLPYSLEMES